MEHKWLNQNPEQEEEPDSERVRLLRDESATPPNGAERAHG